MNSSGGTSYVPATISQPGYSPASQRGSGMMPLNACVCSLQATCELKARRRRGAWRNWSRSMGFEMMWNWAGDGLVVSTNCKAACCLEPVIRDYRKPQDNKKLCTVTFSIGIHPGCGLVADCCWGACLWIDICTLEHQNLTALTKTKRMGPE